MMDAELKAKWVEALRSDQFNQAIGKLHVPETNCYCCLGVLSKIAGLPISEGGFSPNGYTTFHELIGENETGKLWRMNDNHQSFSVIADFIEANL